MGKHTQIVFDWICFDEINCLTTVRVHILEILLYRIVSIRIICTPFTRNIVRLMIPEVEIQAHALSDMATESGISVSIKDPMTCGIAGGIVMLLLGHPAGWGVITLCLVVSMVGWIKTSHRCENPNDH